MSTLNISSINDKLESSIGNLEPREVRIIVACDCVDFVISHLETVCVEGPHV